MTQLTDVDASITLDAMDTQHDTAKAVVEVGADYVFTVNANWSTLLAALKKSPWAKVPRGSQSTQRGHGRRATRTIKVTEVPVLPGWPEFHGAAQVAHLRRTVTKRAKKSVEVLYLITSADHQGAPPATLAAWEQGH